MRALDTETVLDILAEWLPGYTYPKTGPQSRVRVTFVNEGYITAEVETPANSGDIKEFMIRVQIEETA